MGILALVVLLGLIVCQIIVAINIFQNDGALKESSHCSAACSV